MSAQQQSDRLASVTAQSDREIRIERVFDAPRERVFAVYTDPALIPEWWGFRGSEVIVDEMDARTGGRWRFITRHPEHGESAFRGAYREVTAPERIVQTFEWEGMVGYVCVETATFEDLGDGRTKVTTVSLFHTSEERDGMLDAMEPGMNETYQRLDELLERLGA